MIEHLEEETIKQVVIPKARQVLEVNDSVEVSFLTIILLSTNFVLSALHDNGGSSLSLLVKLNKTEKQRTIDLPIEKDALLLPFL